MKQIKEKENTCIVTDFLDIKDRLEDGKYETVEYNVKKEKEVNAYKLKRSHELLYNTS